MSRSATLWERGKNRYAVTPGPNPVPVLGYVSHWSDNKWHAERGGKFLPLAYESATQAAEALLSVAKMEEN